MIRFSPHLLGSVSLSGLLLTTLPAYANFPVYTYAFAGLDLDSDETIDTFAEQITPYASGAFAQIGNPPGSHAYAQTSFGQNLAFAQAVNPPGGPEQVGAISVWSDLFHITGGSGSGQAQVSATINGSFASSYYSAGTYALIKTDIPLLPNDLLAYTSTGIPPLGSSLVLFGFGDSDYDAGPVNMVLTGSFDFTYDQDFFLISVLVVGASDSGVVDFGNTVHFGLTTASGDSTQTGSGTRYVAAVPEPGTWAMLLAGVGLVGLRLRRK